MTPTEQIVELQSGKWKTRVLSAGEGQPVVFLHGPGGLLWDSWLDALSERYRVIAPEHPGSGASQGVEHLEDTLDLVLYYAELLDALHLPSVALVGHSFGGMVAAEIAAVNPDRVGKLVLIAPMGLWIDERPIPDISAIPADQLPAFLFADPGGAAAAALPQPDPADPEALFQAALTMASILQFMWPLPDKGLRRRLYRVKAETLVVWGAQDRLVDPSYGDEFVAAIAGARLAVLDGAGHLPQIERTAELHTTVTNFLD
ncbi:MAG: alpha/beta fold hydrolase [Acidimicrobiaceae bacterium]|nr:alpha/beta fold hydrolase [Acidimicrobiaceae bacterium]